MMSLVEVSAEIKISQSLCFGGCEKFSHPDSSSPTMGHMKISFPTIAVKLELECFGSLTIE